MIRSQWLALGAGVVGVLAGLAFPPALYAATWPVSYDPVQPEDRVGAAAALAASGDTILVGPGT